MSIGVLLVDDQALIRGGLAMVIESQDDMRVVGEVGDGEDVLGQLRRTPADVVLMDIRMPHVDGITATGQVLKEFGEHAPKVLILTTFDTDEHLHAALRAGAAGFILKGARPDEMLAAIRNVAAGDAVIAPSATKRLLARFAPVLPAQDRLPDTRLDSLTDREREVLLEITTGATNPEIALRLSMAEGTVKTHVGRLLSKTGSRDRVGLVLFAHDVGLLS